ncbi:Nn.00g081200.m01.CDS01 [Neocucurbitaria sp. VM-36]
MAIPRGPKFAEGEHFLQTRNGNQMLRLVQSMQEPAAQATLTAALLVAPPAITGRSVTPEKAKKALNAFVTLVDKEALQSYKLRSLITKAWSTIRDQIGKDKAPLDQFFRILCPYLNLPSPEIYLEHLEMGPYYQQGRQANTFSQFEDIIHYYQFMGFAQDFISDASTSSSTFLAQQSSSQTSRTIPLVKVSAQTAGLAHDSRVDTRNKRRAKRQKPERLFLQEQIDNIHVAGGISLVQNISTNVRNNEPGAFCDQLASLLTNHMANHRDNSAALPKDVAANGTNTGSTIPTFG